MFSSKTMITLIVSIAITGLLIAFLAPVAIGNLEDAVTDAEDFEEETITEYTDENIQLNDTDVYNWTTLYHENGDEINATFQYTNDTGSPTGTWSVNGSQEKQTTLIMGAAETLNFTISDPEIDYVIYSVEGQETGPDGNSDYVIGNMSQTVHTTQTYSEATLDIFSLLPMMIALVILMGLIAYIIKVI